MNRSKAKIIAETITNKELELMFISAAHNITDWTKTSSINKSMTKGCAWNILAKDFNVDVNYSKIAKVNMVREFGEFLPEEITLQFNKSKKPTIVPTHQNPDFTNYK